MKVLLSLILIILSMSFSVQAEQSELPEAGELFSSYFARITRGGKFPGIYLEAPTPVQNAFFKRIKKGSWVGLANTERKLLEDLNVNLWGDWYQRANPGSLVLAGKKNESLARESYQRMINSGYVTCPKTCPDFSELMSADWNKLASFKRELWIKNLVMWAPIFNGHTLLWHLSSQFELAEVDVFKNVDIKILDHKNFVSAVHEMGWGGEVYFRGITGPDPKNASRHWILLDDEFLKTQTPFHNTLYQMLEVPAILVHELAHVCQDMEGSKLNYSIEVTSGEDALMIEGMAEALAEKAIYEAGATLDPVNPWKLFIREQAVEIVYREGNETQGNLFPYTVGMPFVTALMDLKKNEDPKILRQNILQYLDATPLKEGRSKITLSDWLKK